MTASRRYIWHYVNAGTTVFDLPVPREVSFADDNPDDLGVTVRLNGPLDVDAWAAWLDFPTRTNDAGVWSYGVRYGWQWSVRCFTAGEVAEAKVLDRVAETFEDDQNQSAEAQIRLTEAYPEEIDLARAILRVEP